MIESARRGRGGYDGPVPRWSGFMLLVVVLFSALRASGQAAHARDGADLVVVVADPTHGPALSQLFRAVLQARLPEVDVRFVPESTWDDTTKRPAATLVFRLDTSRDSVWILRLVEGDRAWQRQLHGVAQDPAAIECSAVQEGL